MFKRKINLIRINKSVREETLDTVLIEKVIEIFVNSEPLVNIVCLPKDLKELTVGFLFSIGIINNIDDIKKIEINEMDNQIHIELHSSNDYKSKNLNTNPMSRVIDSTCGIPSPWRNIIKNSIDAAKSSKCEDNVKISSQIIFSSTKKMQSESLLYKETGGCHSAAIFDFNGTMLDIKEDIGRHNAIDKVIGTLLSKRHDFNKVFLISTGRLTGDSVLKAIRAKIPIVASKSSAIESGIRLAFAYNITLIGFVRGTRMNIYTNSHRIIL